MYAIRDRSPDTEMSFELRAFLAAVTRFVVPLVLRFGVVVEFGGDTPHPYDLKGLAIYRWHHLLVFENVPLASLATRRDSRKSHTYATTAAGLAQPVLHNWIQLGALLFRMKRFGPKQVSELNPKWYGRG